MLCVMFDSAIDGGLGGFSQWMYHLPRGGWGEETGCMSPLGRGYGGEAVTSRNCDLETPFGYSLTQDPWKCSPTPFSLRGNIHQLCSLTPGS